MARHRADSDGAGLPLLCVIALAGGVAIGFVGGAFRWCLQVADRWRVDLLGWAERAPGPGWLVPVAVTALGAALAAAIVRTVPLASGSGIQHVEAVARGEAAPPPLRVVPARFVGGLLSIGSGLVLGREGPTVHMGATIGAAAGRAGHLPDDDMRLSQSVVAGAGLAVAFNAPIGGALFVVEEVTKSLALRVVVPALVAVTAAVSCSRLVLGDHPDFTVDLGAAPTVVWLPLFALFGLATGILGALYNRAVLGFLAAADLLRRVPRVVVAAAVGAVVGLLLVLDPFTAGGGDAVTHRILDGDGVVLTTAAGLLLIRFVAGPLSYAAGTPGGLFAPLLAVGALWGVLFAGVTDTVLPSGTTVPVVPFALAGMVAFFGATVRAPVTGIVLVTEMTATATLTVPMAAATAAAVLVAHLVGSLPIYDSLRQRMERTDVRSTTAE
ncbi:ClC family H(+)/Cl(-) exchange transporter [Prescottella sp. R16]|uniref:ClC family H(+)/Cl(-) exchange transporter n=1 Tax=Prescottella sp. R16 TaxID=3064529 RepID=UPI00272EA8D5|nr:ClC family H(+)/Cl(-) exchange transporter [Prescottella sp. R16]